MSQAPSAVLGLHHVTAITAEARKNLDFYQTVLGQRLVKATVNYDDPQSYHFYFGDELGRPGTDITFFDWPGAQRGRVGPPQVTVTAYAIPAASINFWSGHLRSAGLAVQSFERFGQKVLTFADPDGLQLELIATPTPLGQPRQIGSIPPEHAIHGFHSVTISLDGYEQTAQLLSQLMGFKSIAAEQNRFRYQAGAGNGFASLVDILCVPGARHGAPGAGVVHHVAFRVPTDAEQLIWREKLIAAGFNVSPVMDRRYFHSIYFRAPGGVLFEIATETPGMTADQSAAELGTRLALPPWLEPHRLAIEAALPPVRLPTLL
jgi:catechol 2,3-dioxygenase-like lactoylglutathione lyase family enzyme